MDIAAVGKIRQFRKEEILLDIDGHRLDQSEGVIMVTCADGDQFPDVYKQQVGMQLTQRDSPRLHTLAWNGGALRLVPGSATNRRLEEADTFLDDIKDASVLKGIKTVALYGHYPCGKARVSNMKDLEKVIDDIIKAKRRIKAELPGVGVACFFHVDYPADEEGKQRKRTYFLGAKRWATTQTNLVVPEEIRLGV